jgi:cytochrome c oxidase cbb3-type subunit 3
LLTLYILSLRRKTFSEAYWPRDRVRTEKLGQREFAADGPTLYAAMCSACHGPEGEGRRLPGKPAYPSLANPDFLAVASDEFIRQNILRGRAGQRMPAWSDGGLRTSEIDRIIAYLRKIGGVSKPEVDDRPDHWVSADPARGEELYTAYCAACHGGEGEGIEAPALNHKVLLETATDTYLVETIGRGRRGTSMPGFRRPSPVQPVLTPGEIESLVAFIRSWEKKSP